MKKHAPRSHTKISVSVLTVLICLQPLLLSCGPGRVPPAVDTEEILWTLTNPEHSFNAFLNPDRLDYQLDESLTLRVRVTNDAHLLLFNWDNTGTLTIRLPNAYQQDNAVRAGATYTFPGADADFDWQLSGPVGTERFKVVALRNADDCKAITDLFPQADAAFQQVSGTQRSEIEKKIVTYLRRMVPKDWAEDNQTVEVRAPTEVPLVIQPVTPEMFFQPMRARDDVIIDAGELGKYRFSADTQPPDVPPHIIRPELVDLLNALQDIFKQPMLITSGYRSRQSQIYLWAQWLADHPEHVAALNQQMHPTWEAWTRASQALLGCPPLQSKHQTGEAVDFYWETLAFDSDAQRGSLTEQILKVGGTRDYTPEERQRFSIPADNNYLFMVTAYPSGELGNMENPSGRAYFHVAYRPSPAPAMPGIEHIGTLLASPEPPLEMEKNLLTLANPESSFTVSLETDSIAYLVGDLLILKIRVTKDAHIIIFNWDGTGALAILLPNVHQRDNIVSAGTPYVIPGTDADFEFAFLGPPGVERFKVIALRDADHSSAIIDLFETEQHLASQQFWHWQGSDIQKIEKKVVSHLRRIDPKDWAEDSHAVGVRGAEPPEDASPPVVVPPDYSLGDTVYIKDGGNMYFAEVTTEVAENAKTVAVDIFNEALRKKLGDAVPVELVIGRRVEPPRGWGIHEIMLSFYRDGVWTFTTGVVVFEDYYRLPERINGERVRGSRKVTLGEVRIPIPVSFLSSD